MDSLSWINPKGSHAGHPTREARGLKEDKAKVPAEVGK